MTAYQSGKPGKPGGETGDSHLFLTRRARDSTFADGSGWESNQLDPEKTAFFDIANGASGGIFDRVFDRIGVVSWIFDGGFGVPSPAYQKPKIRLTLGEIAFYNVNDRVGELYRCGQRPSNVYVLRESKMASKHDQAAERLAKTLGAEYNRGKGPDVITKNQVTETETVNTVGEAGRQLQGYNRPAYVQGADDAATQKALEKYKSSSIGVRDPQGNIVRRSTRKRK